jgi:hypothetical protein
VLEHDRPLAQALGPGGRDVLRADDLEHAGAEQPGEKRGPSDTERERGHQNVLRVTPEARGAHHGLASAGQVYPARARQPPAQADGEDEEQQDTEEELRNGDPDHGHGRGGVVGPRVLAQGTDDGGRDRDRERHRHREDDQLEGDRETYHHVVENGASTEDRRAPIPLHELAEPDEVLKEDRLVEPIVLAGLDRVFLGVRVAEQRDDRIARDRSHHDEHDERDAEDGRNDLE